MIAIFTALVAAAFSGLWPAAAGAAEKIALDFRPVMLNPEDSGVVQTGKFMWRGGLQIWSADRRFGGLSSLLIHRDGRRMISLTDKGYWITARLRYDSEGRLTGIGEGRIGALIGPRGRAVAGREPGDAESMARLGNSIAVAFEGRRHRVWVYPPAAPPFSRPPKPLRLPGALASAHPNGGIEALTELPGGKLFMVAERFPKPPADFHGWLFDGRRWRHRSYARHGMFHPVAAAALPRGGMLVLERRYTLVGGVASRIVQLGAAQIESGAVLLGKEVAALERPLVVENFEGIDVRPGPGGTVLVYLVSDDNFNKMLQSTLLLMFSLTP